MIGQTIPFYRDILEIARRSPVSYGVEVECGELEWLLDWADAGIRAASAIEAPSGVETGNTDSAEGESAVPERQTPNDNGASQEAAK